MNNPLRFRTACQDPVIASGQPTSNIQVVMVQASGGRLPVTSGGYGPLIAAPLLVVALGGVRLPRGPRIALR